MDDLHTLLEISSRNHGHLCPRQILGVRIGLRGICLLQFESNPSSKRLLVITETDGCFADGLSAATGCTVGHRTLRVEDFGKVAATFVDTYTSRAVRVAPVFDIRERACDFSLDESRHYFAQMQAYQVMSDEVMMIAQEVSLITSVERIISHPGLRVNCDICGEEIMNEREVLRDDMKLCCTCSGNGYYRPVTGQTLNLLSLIQHK